MNRVTRLWRPAVVDRLEAPEVERLVEDLGRRQVATELHRPGGTERARERAARLGRDADRASAVAVAHQNCLDRMAVAGPKQRLYGAVLRLLLLGDRERRERHVAAQALAQTGRHVRHRVIPCRTARCPLPDLPGAVGRFALLLQRRLRGSRCPWRQCRCDPRTPARPPWVVGVGQWVSSCRAGTTRTGQRACATT